MFETHRSCYRCTCERCGHSWETRWTWHFSAKTPLPKSCAKCKSKQWNSPRVYSGKYVETTFVKREKATGKKAKIIAGTGSD